MPDEKKSGPPTKTRPGTGEPKQWDGSRGGKAMKDQSTDKKTYWTNPNTGKFEEYKGKVYQDDKSKKATPPPKPEPMKATPSFQGTGDQHPAKYLDEVFNHTTGKDPKKKSSNNYEFK